MASNVGIIDPMLKFSLEKPSLPVVSLIVDMVIRGLGRDEDSTTFMTWRKTMIHAAWSCADERMKDGV